jgi:hypothetical protein
METPVKIASKAKCFALDIQAWARSRRNRLQVFPHHTPRYTLAVGCLCTVVWAATSVWSAFRTVPTQIKLVTYSSGQATAFDMARKDIEGFFEIGVLVLGGLWGVGIVKKEDRLRGRDTPEIIMFASATALLIAFLCMDEAYGAVLEQLYWDTQLLILQQQKFIDLFDSPYIRLYHSSVLHTFYCGLGASALATFSLCLLRRNDHEQTSDTIAD